LSLNAVSDPNHPRYGQHLSIDEVDELVKPSDETLELVHEWLQDNEVVPSDYSSTKDWIIVSLPVEAVERLLDTEYHTYEHEDGSRIVRTSKWSLPLHLHEHVDTIQPTTSFFRARANKFEHIDGAVFVPPSYSPPSNPDLDAVCNVSSVTPECFETLYKTKGYKAQAAGKNQVGFTNYLGEHPIRSDTELFASKYRPEALKTAREFPQIVINNGPGDGPLTPEEAEESLCKEANLDVSAIIGVNWQTPLTSYSTGGSPPIILPPGETENTNEPYLDWVNYINKQKSIPQVISTSYADDELTVPRSYAVRVCQQFARIGARGTTLLFASGDAGVGSYGTCQNDKNQTEFTSLYPSGCPYITTVGATKNFEPEVVAYRPAFTDPDGVAHGNYTSGSGFSVYFQRPKYQDKVVSEYIQSLNGEYDGFYNKQGRAYPDIAAQGLYFAYFWNGTEGVISGTSASTPLLGGILSLVNDARIAAGKPSFGFLNPWLYSIGYKGLNDITGGSTVGCNTDGFPAGKGWDVASGWGTPVSDLQPSRYI
jgi:tripeptidyl-peptidase I